MKQKRTEINANQCGREVYFERVTHAESTGYGLNEFTNNSKFNRWDFMISRHCKVTIEVSESGRLEWETDYVE